MKSALVLILGFSIYSGLASADDLYTKAMAVGHQLRGVQDKMHPDDYRYVERSLDSVMDVLKRYGDGGLADIICVSNGETGSFEKFMPYTGGKTLGGGTSKTNCQTMIRGQHADLMCLSNGEIGSFENFSVYDLYIGKEIGGGSSLANCLNVVARATPSYVCVSNGEIGSFEKFQLIDRSSNKEVGGETSLSNCLEMLP
jgi:hypothetical protein